MKYIAYALLLFPLMTHTVKDRRIPKKPPLREFIEQKFTHFEKRLDKMEKGLRRYDNISVGREHDVDLNIKNIHFRLTVLVGIFGFISVTNLLFHWG